MIEYLLSWLGTTAAKAIGLSVMLFLAHKWSRGDYDKQLRGARSLRQEYGLITFLLLLLWWLLIPSGTPDDIVTVWAIATFGLVAYLIFLGVLTLYLIWRFKVAIVIYRGRKK